MGAVLRSVVVPGWGQFYNHRYIKSLAFLGGEAGLLASTLVYHDNYLNSYDKSSQDFYIANRNLLGGYLAGTVVICLLDAYWDAQEYNREHFAGNAANKKIPSPKGAMIRSIIVPGWGQFYNGKRFKAMLICGIQVGTLARSVVYNQLYQNSTIDEDKEFYLNLRNQSTWFLAGSVIYSMLDAFVDAQLSTFDESPILSFDINPINTARSVRVSFRF
ncbi:hypothetical protein JW960_13195 [candidate division KSB1 bacterium]|nr:hypothetical protein [candidate division KSB1 bacterium]